MRVKFTVLGEPKGKGRHRFGRNVKTKAPVTHTPDETVLYENLVSTEFRRQAGSARFEDDAYIDMRVMAYYTIPASTSKKKQRLMVEGKIRPTKKPDMDNIVKIVSDALNQVAYRDDAQIVDAQVRKFYAELPRIEVILQTAKPL